MKRYVSEGVIDNSRMYMANETKKAIQHVGHIIDAWIPWKLLYDEVPGIAIGITYKGSVIYGKGFGVSNITQSTPITPKTCFRIASISKTFTAISVMQLVQERKLGLDDTISQYIPWFAAKTKQADASHITVRQLLSHTAGVFRDGTTYHWSNDQYPVLSELQKEMSHRTVTFENLTRFKYSNFGFAVLGQLIETISGMPYEQYVQTHIIAPLGLTQTFPDYTPEVDQWLANGYSRHIPGQSREIYPNAKTNTYAPATGFVSCLDDLAKYLGALSLEDTRLLPREAKKQLFYEYGRDDDSSYGLGFEIERISRRTIVGHSGGFPGFITNVSLDPRGDVGVIVLTNSIGGRATSLTRGILTMIYQLLDNPQEFKHTDRLDNPSRYEGLYRSRWGDTVVVNVGDMLIAFDPWSVSPMRDKTVLKPTKKDTFSMDSGSGFDSIGEEARFVFSSKKPRATTLMWGSMVMNRVE